MSETVIGLAARGDGITDAGRHIALAAPGDMVRDDGTVAPGPHHVAPPCRHFPRCGSCSTTQSICAAGGSARGGGASGPLKTTHNVARSPAASSWAASD